MLGAAWPLAGFLSAPAPSAHQSAGGSVPSEEELRVMADRAIAGQHKDDVTLDEYERYEHHIVYSGTDRHIADDKTYRVVPTGSGTLKLLVKDGARPVDPSLYRKELRDWEQILVIASDPHNPQQQAALAKGQKKSKDRRSIVDAARKAFRATWLGRETRDGRLLDVLQLNPNPAFQAHSVSEEVLIHARAKIWIDDASGHLVRGDAEIIRDVAIGGGILGKLYRGGRFSLENAQVTPDLWLPSRLQYDYSGRKLFFGFESHEVTETSRYRRVGTPAQALTLVRAELAAGSGIPADP